MGLLTLDMERERLMPRLPQMPRPPQRLMLDTMVLLPQLSRLPQFVSQSQSRSVTRSQSPPQERLEEPSARLWLTSPPLKTAQRPSPPSASRSAPRLPTAQLSVGHDTKVGPAEVVAHAAAAPAVAVA